MHRSIRGILLVAAAVAGAVVTPRPSAACGNAVSIYSNAQLITEADKYANEGRCKAALQHLDAFFADPRSPFGSGQELTDRAYIIAARNIVRCDGGVRMPNRTAHAAAYDDEGESKEEVRKANLAEAVALLKKAEELKKGDPASTADLAEALSRTTEGRAEALTTLAGLEDKGVLASAWGYAALARLRATSAEGRPAWVAASVRALDRSPRELSIARCKNMTKQKDLCEGAPLPERFKHIIMPMPPAMEPPRPPRAG